MNNLKDNLNECPIDRVKLVIAVPKGYNVEELEPEYVKMMRDKVAKLNKNPKRTAEYRLCIEEWEDSDFIIWPDD